MDDHLTPLGLRARASVIALLGLVAIGCVSNAPQARELVRWKGHDLPARFTADHGAIRLEPSTTAPGLTRRQAMDLAHEILQDTPKGLAQVPGCDGCVTPTAKIIATRPGRVTLDVPTPSHSTSPHPLRDQPAWVIAYTSPAPASCPNQPVLSRPPPRNASSLHALVISNPHRSSAIAYQGAGTGGCARRTTPTLDLSPSAAIDLGPSAA